MCCQDKSGPGKIHEVILVFNSEQEVTIHGLGAAINRAINLALQLEHRGQGTVEVFLAILLDEAEYDLKNYGHQGGCYQPRPITPSKASSGDKGMLSSAEYSPDSRCCLLSCNSCCSCYVFRQ